MTKWWHKVPIIRWWRDLLARKEELEAIKTESYVKGINDATSRLTIRVNEQTSMIDRITIENIKHQQEREIQILAHEDELRKYYEKQVDTLKDRQDARCDSCRQQVDNERAHYRRLQMKLTEKMRQLNEIYNWLHQHASLISDEQDSILKSAGRVKTSKATIDSIKGEIDRVASDSAKLLEIQIDHMLQEEENNATEGTQGTDRADQPEVSDIDNTRRKRTG